MKRYVVAICLAGSIAGTAQATVDCSEMITAVIVHSNGSVYFQTDHTCSGTWCQLAWSDAETIKKGYAMLLAAKAQAAPLVFDWPTLSGCSQFNVFGASPGYVVQTP